MIELYDSQPISINGQNSLEQCTFIDGLYQDTQQYKCQQKAAPSFSTNNNNTAK